MLDCYWKSTYGIECFGCGFQRSAKLLLEGDVLGSIIMFPALIPFIITIIYTLLHLNLKFKNGARHIVILFSVTVSIMLISYFYKLLL